MFLAVLLFSAIHLTYSQTRDWSIVKAEIGEKLDEKIVIFDKETKVSDTPKEISVKDDRIEFKLKNQNAVLYFADLVDDSIRITLIGIKAEIALKNFVLRKTIMNRKSYIRFDELRNDLVLIQKPLQTKIDASRSLVFEQKAREYRALKVKPAVSEEQRKFIVQANSFNQQKNYNKAIELYKKAIEVDQVAYPAGYSNLALLSAQINNFGGAINFMKKYLLLEPEATDARSAQDKIYEWEAQISK
jgi:tetratricopeptide (TPR) repeat protein